MSKFTRNMLIAIFFGIIIAAAGFSDAMLYFKGDTVNLNGSKSDFSQKALAEGEINFVYGPFAIMETTNKTYGITTSKTETDFYIVGNFDTDFYIVYSTVNSDMVAKLNNADEQWYNYLTDDTISEWDIPDINISFKGKVAAQPTDSDYTAYLDETMDDLSNIGISRSDLAEMRIIDGEVTIATVSVFFIGIAITLICTIILIVSAKKKRNSEEFY